MDEWKARWEDDGGCPLQREKGSSLRLPAPSSLCRTCSFVTQRLVVKEWHSLSADEWTPQDLADVVKTMLTTRVTRSLPPTWQGAYTRERAHEWVKERDREGVTLLAVERSSRMPVGLVILSERNHEGVGGAEVRLGYLLAEATWGRGLAGELVQGFVEWCRKARVATVVGGVARDNVPSRRVLEKNGFVCDHRTEGAAEQLFKLRLQPPS